MILNTVHTYKRHTSNSPVTENYDNKRALCNMNCNSYTTMQINVKPKSNRQCTTERATTIHANLLNSFTTGYTQSYEYLIANTLIKHNTALAAFTVIFF